MHEAHAIKSYRDLKVWQLGMEIAEQAYHLSRMFPGEELYGLTSQLRRAAVSVPANIAEGHARASTKEYQRYLSIAVGSLAEVETYLELCRRLGYGNPKAIARLQDVSGEERRMLRGPQRTLSQKSPTPRP